MKKALITGVTGQDGSYLLELLLEKGYEVHGVIRRSSTFNTSRIDHIINDIKYSKNFHFHHGDLCDPTNINNLILDIKPNEIYNLAAQSHVKVSFSLPDYTAQVGALGTLRILDAIHKSNLDCKLYQASTSELYGNIDVIPQTESTPFYPRSPYAVSKLFAYWSIINYREAYDIFACNGILFNHESPRRGETFVTRKITKAVSRIKLGQQKILKVGNLNSKRDWGYAPEYVYGMWKMLQQENADDFILATGKTYSVRTFIEMAFKVLDIGVVWEGTGLNEVGRDSVTNKIIVSIDPIYFRPTEVNILCGDSSKAKKHLDWSANTNLEELIEIMVKSDFDLINKK